MTGADVSKCLEEIKTTIFLHTRATFDEKPSNTKTMFQTFFSCSELYIQIKFCPVLFIARTWSMVLLLYGRS